MIKSHVLYRLSYALTFRNLTTFQAVIPFQFLSDHDPPEADFRFSGSCSSPRCVGGGARRVNSAEDGKCVIARAQDFPEIAGG